MPTPLRQSVSSHMPPPAFRSFLFFSSFRNATEMSRYDSTREITSTPIIPSDSASRFFKPKICLRQFSSSFPSITATATVSASAATRECGWIQAGEHDRSEGEF